MINGLVKCYAGMRLFEKTFVRFYYCRAWTNEIITRSGS